MPDHFRTPRADGLPSFITFTGVDDRTSLADMAELSSSYPIEWAMLFSPKRQGLEPRYPGGDAQSRFFRADHLRRAAHLCGAYARDIMDGRRISPPADLFYFDRLQVNHIQPRPQVVADFVAGWGEGRGIVQSRVSVFPPSEWASSQLVDWLFDASGGRGIAPDAWPPHPGGDRMVGYAGGIAPDNVADVIAAVRGPDRYWIDMESGVRTDDWLDLAKCEAVCEAVYGEAAHA